MKPFRDRNPAIIGIIGLSAIAVLLVGAFRAQDLPIIGSGDTYQAEFAEIGGLEPGNEVRVAGVPVGSVDNFELDGNKVLVTFTLDQGTDLGQTPSASIGVRTLLGAQYLAIQPGGTGRFDRGGTIPIDRTKPPYDVVQAFSDLSELNEDLDTASIASALNALSDIAERTPEEFRAALRGVSDLSRNLADRDQQINTLLKNLKKVTGVLNARDDELERIFADATTLFDAVTARRQSIHTLLVSTQQISTQLSGLVDDVDGELKPALTQLEAVTGLLQRNQESLDRALTILPGFLTVFADALGTGPWFDTYIKIGGE